MDFPFESGITVEKLSKWSATILIVEIRLFWSLNPFLCWCFTIISWKLPKLESYDFLGPFDQLIFLFELFTLLHFKPIIRLLTCVFFVYLIECLDCNLRWSGLVVGCEGMHLITPVSLSTPSLYSTLDKLSFDSNEVVRSMILFVYEKKLSRVLLRGFEIVPLV